ncbi:hypothetical protein AB1Y20_014085 [Prymnesium parvum]|uniref:ABC transporter domain-containing protein n=1 Tax=Prymnesium parvum TaxID=97485 RepID=A0AB34IIB8_PRYPA
MALLLPRLVASARLPAGGSRTFPSVRSRSARLSYSSHRALLRAPPERRSAHKLSPRRRAAAAAAPPPASDEDALITLTSARLGFGRTAATPPLDLRIHSPPHGGHLLLGPNGCGKTLLADALTAEGAGAAGGGRGRALSGGVLRHARWHERSASLVSFESHQSLLASGGSVYASLSRGGTLSAAARFLVVRFGLHPLLYRPVTALSTGEIRKVLLARALARRPQLLVLDNAFDGLDRPSRASLAELISHTLRGFSQLLVQGVDANATARTQASQCVLLLTHRPDEIVDEFQVVSSFREDGTLHTLPRGGANPSELMRAAVASSSPPTPLPSAAEVAALWQEGMRPHRPLVEARRLCVQRGEESILSELSWMVEVGQHWLIAGGNGAGKSTLSRLLAHAHSERISSGDLSVLGTPLSHGSHTLPTQRAAPPPPAVGWVSTEAHLQMVKSPATVNEILSADGGGEATPHVARWLGVQGFLEKPFGQLSQGEQKLVLIAAALARRPAILILDEPCQGLDLHNRERVLQLVDIVCQASYTQLVYITHHYEEVLPCISHVLHLRKGIAAYMGVRERYFPQDYAP